MGEWNRSYNNLMLNSFQLVRIDKLTLYDTKIDLNQFCTLDITLDALVSKTKPMIKDKLY